MKKHACKPPGLKISIQYILRRCNNLFWKSSDAICCHVTPPIQHVCWRWPWRYVEKSQSMARKNEINNFGPKFSMGWPNESMTLIFFRDAMKWLNNMIYWKTKFHPPTQILKITIFSEMRGRNYFHLWKYC